MNFTTIFGFTGILWKLEIVYNREEGMLIKSIHITKLLTLEQELFLNSMKILKMSQNACKGGNLDGSETSPL